MSVYHHVWAPQANNGIFDLRLWTVWSMTMSHGRRLPRPRAAQRFAQASCDRVHPRVCVSPTNELYLCTNWIAPSYGTGALKRSCAQAMWALLRCRMSVYASATRPCLPSTACRVTAHQLVSNDRNVTVRKWLMFLVCQRHQCKYNWYDNKIFSFPPSRIWIQIFFLKEGHSCHDLYHIVLIIGFLRNS